MAKSDPFAMQPGPERRAAIRRSPTSARVTLLDYTLEELADLLKSSADERDRARAAKEGDRHNEA